MSRIVRKRDTGEVGNAGEFGTISRSDADISLAETPGGIHRETGDSATGPQLRVPTWSVERIEHKVELANRRLEREGIAE